MSYRYVIMGVLLFVLGNGNSVAQGVEISERLITRAYKVDAGCYVEILNKYGDIEVESWDKDSVRIEVQIRAISDKGTWRNMMLDYIDVEFAATSGFVIAETTWKEGASFWRKKTYQVAKGLGSDRIEVNYVVHLPKTMPLEIENTFGNVFMSSHSGDLEVEVHHGDFRARNLVSLQELNIRYGKAKINRVDKGEIELSSGSSLDLKEAGELMLSSSSSDVEIDEVDVLNITSRHDDISLNRPSIVNGSFSLTDLRIHHLEKGLKANCKFGTVRIQDIGEEVERIDIEGNKTDIIINIPPDFAGRFHIDVDDEESITYPDDMYIVSKGVGEDKRLKLNGSMGSHAGTEISVDTTNGYVEIGN